MHDGDILVLIILTGVIMINLTPCAIVRSRDKKRANENEEREGGGEKEKMKLPKEKLRKMIFGNDKVNKIPHNPKREWSKTPPTCQLR